MALENVKEGEQVIDEGPTHSWFAYAHDEGDPTASTIRPLNDAAKNMIRSETKMSEFQNQMQRVYKQKAGPGQDPFADEDDDPHSGGTMATGTGYRDGTVWVIGAGVMVFTLVLVRLRKIFLRG